MQAALLEETLLPELNIIIRAPKLDDIPAVVDIENRCFSLYRLKAKNFRYLMRHGHCDFVIAEGETRKMGYAISLYHKNSRQARIYSIGVLPEFQRQNLGNLLVEELRSRAKSRGMQTIHLEVDAANKAAIRFYEKQGFIKYGIVMDYYGQSRPAIRYKQSLI